MNELQWRAARPRADAGVPIDAAIFAVDPSLEKQFAQAERRHFLYASA
jgi:hypothetical protein